MSQWLCAQEVGYVQSFCEASPKINYIGNATFRIKKVGDLRKPKLGLLVGGTGVTPIFQILNAMRLAKDQSVEVKMIYSNKTAADVLLKDELDAINAECPNITITYTLTRADTVPDWAR